MVSLLYVQHSEREPAMTALATRTNAVVSKQKGLIATPAIKEQIQTTLSDVETTHQENIVRSKNLRSLISSWNSRIALVAKKIEDAKENNPDALYSLEVLQDQAQRYALGYAKQLEDEDEYRLAVEKSIPQLTATLRQLEAIDKVSLLDAKLQKITAGTDIANDRLPVTNTRDIQILLHTAQALVELKKGK